MRKITILTALLSVAHITFAQKEIELKLYQNTDVFKVTTHYNNVESSSQQVKFSRLSLAVSFHKKKLFHELELFVPKIDESSNDLGLSMNYHLDDPTFGDARRTSAYSFRYELSKEIRTTNKTNFTLGVAINPLLADARYISSVPNRYNRYYKFYGASINFIPRVRYALTSKALIELSIPFKIYDAVYEWQKIANPAIPIRQQENGGWVYTFFENAFTARLGFAYKL